MKGVVVSSNHSLSHGLGVAWCGVGGLSVSLRCGARPVCMFGRWKRRGSSGDVPRSSDDTDVAPSGSTRSPTTQVKPHNPSHVTRARSLSPEKQHRVPIEPPTSTEVLRSRSLPKQHVQSPGKARPTSPGKRRVESSSPLHPRKTAENGNPSTSNTGPHNAGSEATRSVASRVKATLFAPSPVNTPLRRRPSSHGGSSSVLVSSSSPARRQSAPLFRNEPSEQGRRGSTRSVFRAIVNFALSLKRGNESDSDSEVATASENSTSTPARPRAPVIRGMSKGRLMPRGSQSRLSSGSSQRKRISPPFDASKPHIAFVESGPTYVGRETEFFRMRRKPGTMPRLVRSRRGDGTGDATRGRQSMRNSTTGQTVVADALDYDEECGLRTEIALLEQLLSFVPRCVVARHARRGAAPKKPDCSTFPAAILFVDISGFTALNERLDQKGGVGGEVVTRHINAYFGAMMNKIYAHGGDVLKFAGDAMVIQFGDRGSREDLSLKTLRAVQCAMEIQNNQGVYSADGVKLTLHMGVGAGDLITMLMGGVAHSWEFVVTGSPLAQLKTAVDNSGPGTVVCSAEAYKQIENTCTAQKLKSGDFMIKSITNPVTPAVARPIQLLADIEPAIRCYIGKGVQARLDAGQRLGWLAELRQVTTLFVNLSLPMKDNEGFDFMRLNDALREMQIVLLRLEAYVNKLLVDDKGTTLLAAFGVPPFAHEDDPSRGVEAALEIQRALYKLGFQNSIGITTGRAFVGAVGSKTRQEFTVMGDVVNLSARLMKAAKECVLCDEATYSAVAQQSSMIFEKLPPITVKGKSKAIAVFRPHRSHRAVQPAMQSDKAENTQKDRDLDLEPMIGRQTELYLIQQAIHKGQEGLPVTIFLVGPEGSGKTLLLLNGTAAAHELELVCVEGLARDVELQTPYYVWRRFFRHVFKMKVGDHMEETCWSIAKQFENPSLSKWKRYLPLLNDLGIGLAFPESSILQRLSVLERNSRLLQMLVGIVASAVSVEPIVVSLDNGQWMDASSWVLLERLHQIPSLILLVSLRPLTEKTNTKAVQIFRHLTEDKSVTVITMGAMPRQDVAALLCSTLKCKSIQPQIVEIIMEKSQGNPLFAMEVARSLQESNLLSLDDRRRGTLIAGTTGRSSVVTPTSIQGVIVSRLDRLPPGKQIILKVAAVIGPRFSTDVLQAILPFLNKTATSGPNAGKHEKDDIIHDLVTLHEYLDVCMIQKQEGNVATVAFRQTMVQEAAYNLLPIAQRKQLHKRIADWFENIHGGESKYTAVIAHHLTAAIDDDERDSSVLVKAINFLEKASHMAIDGGLVQEGMFFLKKALGMIPHLHSGQASYSVEVDLLLKLGLTLITFEGAEHHEVEGCFARVRTLCKKNHPETLFPATLGLFRFHFYRGNVSKAKDLAQELHSMAHQGKTPRPECEMLARRSLCNVLFIKGDFIGSMKHCEHGLEIGRKNNPVLGKILGQFGVDTIVDLMAHRFLLLWLMGEVDACEKAVAEAVGMLEQWADPLDRAHALLFLLIYASVGCRNVDMAAPFLSQFHQLMSATDRPESFAIYAESVQVIEGWADVHRGKVSDGLQQAREGWATVRQSNAVFMQSFVLAVLTEAFLLADEYSDALGIVLEGQEHSQDCYLEAELLRLRADAQIGVHDAQGNDTGEGKLSRDVYKAAKHDLQKALDLAKRQGAKSLELRAAISFGKIVRRQGNTKMSRKTLKRAISNFGDQSPRSTNDLTEASHLQAAL